MIKAIKGTKDLLFDDLLRFRELERVVKETLENFNYSEIRTPVFEETRLFSRSIGEETDIVSKEMYTFTDKGGNSLTLKPEMTASVVRAFIEHSLGKQFPLSKFYYIAPMFRQERPQAGRLRQFHQFGAEALGSKDPRLDAEMIIMAYDILRKLGLKQLQLKINSLGTPEAREKYKKLLRDYLRPRLNELTEESRKRFEKNVLRIFDSKAENDRNIMANAPRLLEYLDGGSLQHFEKVKSILDSANIPYETDTTLVRGLDYYTDTTFEIVSDVIGAQSALCGGGRYDLLAEQLGGAATPGVGFAAGMERILLACEKESIELVNKVPVVLYVARIEKELSEKAYEMALYFRRKGIRTETDYLNRSMKAQLREANKLNAKNVLILGGEEYSRGKVVLKNMETGTQEEYPLDTPETILSALAK